MISELFSSLAAPVFAALLLLFFLKSRSREINGREASSNAAGNDATAGGASSTHSSTGVPERATSSGPAKDAAANEGTAAGDSGACTSTGVSEMATSSGPGKDAAANLGIARDDSVALSSGANNDATAINGMATGDSGTHTSTEVPEIDTWSQHDYEVFLSYHGNDTRATFTDHLYTRLTEIGIHTFKDDKSLRDGEEFGPALLRAIKQSKILIPIFSKSYASSPWCLRELAQMIECKKNNTGQKIIPIFYDVGSEEVRCQSGDYGKAFSLYESEKRYDQKIVTNWRAALKAVVKMQGHGMRNRREGEFVKKFTREVFNELKKASLVVSDYLVGVDNHVDAIMEKIGAGTSETRIVGIHGMGGIGKTTIAKIIFNKFSHDFENCCFLRDIRETSKTSGIQCLQKQLICSILKMECTDIKDIDEGTQTIKNRLSNKRVLLLLDDVEQVDHIDALVCKRDWLGKGSKIIITSRRIDVLKVREVDNHYEVTGMDRDQSLQLFSKHAFRRDSPLDEYINQSDRAIKIAGGLPLALEVIGSLLSRTKKEKWDATLKMLESVPHDKIQNKLKISYDALNLRQQRIFLDIACLFIGYDKDILVFFWDESNFFPEVAVEVLQNLSLIKINEDNKVWMHDQLRDLGREMVLQESNMKIEKQSRVWDHKQGFDLLRKHKGKKEVEALRLNFDHEGRQYCFTYEGFESLPNLKFLQVDGSEQNFDAEERLLWHELTSNVIPINENSDLLPQLRWLSWRDFPLALNVANFFMEDVVILNLSESEITNDWEGWSHMKVMKNLKVLNLSSCNKLRRLPVELGRYLESLECLSLDYCGKLESLSDSIKNLESLTELDISWTMIKELPDFIGRLKNLKKLKMQGSGINKIPDDLWTIEKLEEIEVSKKYGSEHFHVNVGNCIDKNQSLRILKLVNAEIYSLPRLPESLVALHLTLLYMDKFPDLSNLTNLKELYLRFRSHDSDEESHGEYGESDGESGSLAENPIPRWIRNVSKQESLDLRSPYEATSPTDLTLPPHLKKVTFLDCPNEESDGESDGPVEGHPIPGWMGNLSKLEFLCLSSPYVTTSPIDLTLPPHLKELRLEYCTNLGHLPRLPSSLSSLYLFRCKSLCAMEDLSNLNNLSSLQILFAAIEEIQGLGCLENLRDLKLFSLEQVKILPDLRNLNKLRSLEVNRCPNLVEIQGELPQFLDKLHISKCDSLRNLPDLSSLMGKQEVKIKNCSKLNMEAILGFARINPRDLRLLGFGQLQILPDLSNSSELRRLEVSDCCNLIEIQSELPQSLEILDITSCKSLQKLPDLSSLKELKYVTIQCCTKLKGEAILSARRSQAHLWENLQYLHFYGLEQTEILPDLSNFSKLKCLKVQSCDNLIEIQGKLPVSMEVLEISSCINIQKLPDLMDLNGLRTVKIYRCFGLNVEAISSLCSKNSVEFVEEDRGVGLDMKSESEYEWEDEE